MRAILEEKNVWSAIGGSVADAMETASPSDDHKASDAQAKRLLLFYMENKYFHLVDDKKPAKAAWRAIEDTFKSRKSRVFLLKEFNRLDMTTGESVDAFVDRVQAKADELALLDAPVDAATFVEKILVGLVARFNSVVDSSINKEDIKLHELLESLYIIESRDGPETSAAAREKVCYRCKQTGHFKANCPLRNRSSNASSDSCSFCGADDHTESDCEDKKAYLRLKSKGLLPRGNQTARMLQRHTWQRPMLPRQVMLGTLQSLSMMCRNTLNMRRNEKL